MNEWMNERVLEGPGYNRNEERWWIWIRSMEYGMYGIWLGILFPPKRDKIVTSVTKSWQKRDLLTDMTAYSYAKTHLTKGL